MALPVLPTVANGGLLPTVSESADQFYVDYANGADGAGVAGSRAAPWKTLPAAVNSRLASGGSHDHFQESVILNLRNTSGHGDDLAAGADWTLGGSTAETQNTGGTFNNPWVIRTDPEDAENAAQGSGNQAHVYVRTVLNTGLWYTRFERVRFGSSLVTDFDAVIGVGSQWVQLFYCEIGGMAQNGLEWLNDGRSPSQTPQFCGTWGCLIHDGGDDVTANPHDHGIYAGSTLGSSPGANDCWSICDVIYRMTGSAVQWYENADRFLIAHGTFDENSYPTDVTQRRHVEVGGDSPNYSRDCLVVNTLMSTIPNVNEGYAIHLNQSGVGSSNKNAAHHNGYFVDAPNEDTTAGNGYPNAIDYLGDNVDADPLYTDRANRDYRLQTGSPMFGAGDPDYTPPTDFDGNPFNASDIGAFANPVSGVAREWVWRFS